MIRNFGDEVDPWLWDTEGFCNRRPVGMVAHSIPRDSKSKERLATLANRDEF